MYLNKECNNCRSNKTKREHNVNCFIKIVCINPKDNKTYYCPCLTCNFKPTCVQFCKEYISFQTYKALSFY